MARIMVVDDAKIMRINISKMFEELGHEVVCDAKDGIEACQKYEDFEPDLVTMDITMPKMGGIEAIDKIYSIHKDAKIIVVSSHSQRDLILESISKGAAYYILKPIKLDALSSAISKLL
jgi:two-component system chemotaxis response regulator CheY